MSGRYGIHDSWLPDRVIMVLIAIWPVQKSENAVHLTGHKDSGTKQILWEKWRPAGTGFEGSKFRIFLSRRDIGMYAIFAKIELHHLPLTYL